MSVPAASPQRDRRALVSALVVGAVAVAVLVAGIVRGSTTVPVHRDATPLRFGPGYELWSRSGAVRVDDLSGFQRLASDLTPVAVALAILALIVYELVRRFRAPVDIEGDSLGRLGSLFVVAGVVPAALGLVLDAWALWDIRSRGDWSWLEVREPVVATGYVLIGVYILVFERRDRRRSLFTVRSAREAGPTEWDQRLAALAAERPDTTP